MALVSLHKRQHVEYAFGAKYAARIDINSDNFSSDYDGYTMLINPESSQALTNQILDLDGQAPGLVGGGDLRVCTDYTDASTRLAIDVQRFEPNNNPLLGEMELWLEAGSVLQSTTKTIFLLWGIPGGTQPARAAAYGSEEVWNQPLGRDYRLISHLSDGASNSVCVDSSPNNSTMAKRAAAEPAETTSSPFRSSLAQDFDNAIANWIDCSPNANFGLGDEITISFWLKADAASIGYEKVVSRKNIWNSLTNWEVSMYDARPDLMLIYGSSGVATAQGPPGLDVTDWTYLTVTYSGTRVTFDANALPNALGTVAAIVDDTSWPLTLGMQAGHSDAQYRGLMDEVRLSLGAQSRDNHITDYRGMKDPAAHAKIDILM